MLQLAVVILQTNCTNQKQQELLKIAWQCDKLKRVIGNFIKSSEPHVSIKNLMLKCTK